MQLPQSVVFQAVDCNTWWQSTVCMPLGVFDSDSALRAVKNRLSKGMSAFIDSDVIHV